jgi:hypothetical protein
MYKTSTNTDSIEPIKPTILINDLQTPPLESIT